MVITDKIIYLELEKTGSTFVVHILKNCGNKFNRIGMHNNVYKGKHINKSKIFKNRLFVGNIRNPFDWYVSLWTFGCDGLGRILQNTKHLNGDIYDDRNNVENFHRFLHLLLNDKNYYLKEGYKNTPFSENYGFMTYLYMRLLTQSDKVNFREITNNDILLNYDNKNNVLDIVLRQETLNEDIINNVEKLGLDKQKILKFIDKRPIVNSSERQKDYRKYYNDNTIKLIKEKDFLFFDKYNYKF